MTYRIRRDKSALLQGHMFSGQRPSRWRRPLIAMVIISALLYGIVVWQLPQVRLVALQAIGQAPTSTPTALEFAERANYAFWRGDLNMAVLHYTEAANQNSQDVGILYELVHMLVYRSYGGVTTGDDEAAALQWAQKTLEASPADARAHTVLCFAQVTNSMYDDAVQSCRRAIDINPDVAEAHAYLALAYFNLNRLEEADQESALAIKLSPDSLDVNTIYGVILANQRQYTAAQVYYTKATQINPRLTYPYFNLAYLYYVMGIAVDSGFFEKAIETYNKVLTLDRRNAKAYIRLCQTYMITGEFNLARDNCTNATTVDTASSEAWGTLGEVLYRTSHYDEAIAAFEQCAALEQSARPSAQRQIQCWAYRGLSHILMQRCAEGTAILKELLRMTDNDEAIRLSNIGLDRCNAAGIP